MDENAQKHSRDDFERMTSFTKKEWLTFLVGFVAFSMTVGISDTIDAKAERQKKDREEAIKQAKTEATLIKTETKDKEYFFFDTDKNLETTEYIGTAPSNNEIVPPSKVGENKTFGEWKKALPGLTLEQVRE